MILKKNQKLIKQNKKNNIYQYLKENIKFLIENPELLNILEFPSNWKNKDKIIDFNLQQSKKLQKENKLLKSIIQEILKTTDENFKSQNKIFNISLQITKSKSFNVFLNILKNNCLKLFDVDFVNIFSNNEDIINKNYENIIEKITEKKINQFFKDNNFINLLNNSNAYYFFFPKQKNIIKSFILLKIKINKNSYLIISLGSKNKNKFSKKQGSELMAFFINICEQKIKSFLE